MAANTNNLFSNPIPAKPDPGAPVGVGLRFRHHKDLIEQQPDIGWIEVHPENYFSGGKPRHYLTKARELYPLSLHAVGLSLGSTERVSKEHLADMKELIDIYEPFHVSDHASWSMSGNAHLNDLMPLPYTSETLATLCRNIDETQEYFGRQILVENPSTYIAFANNEMTEYEFMNAAAKQTGCKILLDVNNIYVQSHNHEFDPYTYIDGIDPQFVGEMHLAGHSERAYENTDKTLLIDTHSKPVRSEVWDLYAHAARRFGVTPTLIEWDEDIPALEVLVTEAHSARDILFEQQESVPHAAE